jgi:hypothetical protein
MLAVLSGATVAGDGGCDDRENREASHFPLLTST